MVAVWAPNAENVSKVQFLVGIWFDWTKAKTKAISQLFYEFYRNVDEIESVYCKLGGDGGRGGGCKMWL